MVQKKILITTNSAWNIFNFRAGLVRSLVEAGYDVVAAAPSDRFAPRLVELGCRYVRLDLDSKGTHPGRDLLLLWRYIHLLRCERPDVVLGFTVKPNIYGSIAAHLLRIPVINNIAGLGETFTRGKMLSRVVQTLYRLSLSRSQIVFFQNVEDQTLMVSAGVVNSSATARLPGSGVDLKRFTPSPLPNGPRLRFLMVARLLREKGVTEFVQAARILRARGAEHEFCLLGYLGEGKPGEISSAQIKRWVSEGAIRYLGSSDDVRVEVGKADCVVLPSYYREGTPRALLEAAAMGRPVVTTDWVGCRNTVDQGVSGLLCEPRNAADLAEKMAAIAAMTPKDRQEMGMLGRRKVEREFDEQLIIGAYLASIREASEARISRRHIPIS